MSSDQFQDALNRMFEVYRSKRADYAEDDDPFSNFRFVARAEGRHPADVALTLLLVKVARLQALGSNGRGPDNESVLDTCLDLANYGVIHMVLRQEEQ